MSDQTIVNAEITKTPGRFIARARQQFLVTDSTVARGGAEEAWTAGELLLAALGTCAISSVTHFAREEDVELADVTAATSYTRDPDDPTRYGSVELAVTTQGVSQPVAEHLVQLYTENCPVFGTVSRGAGITVTVHAEPAGNM
jgi:uncharacterized OsmC-like protein